MVHHNSALGTYFETDSMLYRYLCFLALYYIASVQGSCPNGFTKHGGSCYHIIRIKATWAEARTYCHAFGSTLASIETAEENTYIVQFLRRNQNAFKSSTFWFGGNDIAETGTWAWEGSLTPIVGFSNWKHGVPDNGGDDDMDEHCMEIDANNHWSWNDNECREKFLPVCETSSLNGDLTGGLGEIIG